MKEDTSILILLIAIVAVILFLFTSRKCTLKCNYSENFGQDASIRAQSGWIAGPKGMYGYDPIDQFAEQIEEQRRMSHMRNYSDSSVMKSVDPVEAYRENHYPYVLDDM